MRPLALAVLFALVGASAAQAAKPAHRLDQVWAHPEFFGFKLRSIAMLPAATFDHNLEAEKLVQGEWGRKFAGTGYRWVSATTARDLLRAAGGDSLLKVIKESVLSQGRIDSLLAPALCARLRTDALLTVRVDQWSQIAIEPGQSGKPSTTLQLRAALVDSSGRLLWRVMGSETVEGIYVAPSEGLSGASGSAVTRSTGLRGSTAAGAPPAGVDVLDRLFTRWAKVFPANPAPADSAK
jgi:hypothetical protein